MSVSRAIVALVLAAAVLPGQNDPAGRAQAELARSQRALQQNRSEVDRLLEMRLRHDLGLPTESDASTFRSTATVTTESMERAQSELRDEDAATAALLERYNKLKNEVGQLQAEAKAQAADRRAAELVVPQANSAPVRVTPSTSPSAPATSLDGIAQQTPPAPVGETTVQKPQKAALPDVDLGLDPIRAQIHGSADHQRVAQALFKAGQVLMDRAEAARAQGQAPVAEALDVRAKERLVRAVDELAPLLAESEPPFPALFYLGRCRELLFRMAQRYDGLTVATTRDWQQREQEVREPFLRITARDVAKKGQRGEVEVLGPWGMAAQSAMEHFRWMNLNSGYDPRASIQAITWPGERAQ